MRLFCGAMLTDQARQSARSPYSTTDYPHRRLSPQSLPSLIVLAIKQNEFNLRLRQCQRGWCYLDTAIESLATMYDCPAPIVTDGDSIRCGDERLRLLGIDAPEFHCPRNRQCAPGDPSESKRSLEVGVRQGQLTYRLVTVDRYGRSVVMVWAGSVNLSCWQLQRGQAVYVARWDNGGRIAKACGL
ncbi:thermonuclease family protein [Sphingomicrobium flavum]|uniref:thermonuclease family protein n=1 Tax=Sphingomicrobium flavum TaxID=1229164 RepID=UPI0028A08AE3|nr:thermonuclease family protein [Sphingomicrobium flavum]